MGHPAAPAAERGRSANCLRHSPHQEVDLMNYAESILPEFDREMANTRKVLERVPENKLDWQAHPKSHTIGWNANHLAEILGWVEGALTAPSWDFAPNRRRTLSVPEADESSGDSRPVRPERRRGQEGDRGRERRPD